MSDRPLDMLVVRDMPDGTFAVADALQGLRMYMTGSKAVPRPRNSLRTTI